MKKNNLYKRKLKILEDVKKNIIIEGWGNDVLKKTLLKKKYKEKDINKLFPEGYKTLLKLYFFDSDKKMTEVCKNLNLIKMKTPKRIREIILLRFKINHQEKELVKKTFYYLLLPQNTKILISSVYNTVDQIWHLAGDNSTDYNFYTKRIILSSIYIPTFLYWINKNRTDKEIKEFLDNLLNKTSKISKMKKNIPSILNRIFKLVSVRKDFSKSRQ